MIRARRLVLAAALALATSPFVDSFHPHSTSVLAAPPGDDAVVAFEVRGVGTGHGRGLSQWGSYGRALAGQSWQDILNAYYGGTAMGDRSGARISVRLTAWDALSTVGVISTMGTLRVPGSAANFASVMAVETGTNQFTIYGSTSDKGCPAQSAVTVPTTFMATSASGDSVRELQRLLDYFGFSPGPIDGVYGGMTAGAVGAFQTSEGLAVTGTWTAVSWEAAQIRLDSMGGSGVVWGDPVATNVAGPIRFTTSQAEGGSADQTLGLCTSTGAVTHYRGHLELHHTQSGNRVVNDVSVEAYLRGVVPRESPAYWGDGVGINALRAQAVAARSYGLSQNRSGNSGYHGVATTCDTTSCQVYGGAGTRASANSGFRPLEHVNTDRAIADTVGAVRVWAGTNNLVSTEFSASNGARTAGGAFPPVDDPLDDQPGNPNHVWTRVIDADRIAAAYGLGSANNVVTARDASSPYDGIWANEVRLGNGAAVSAWDFRNEFDLPAPGFELVPIRRTLSGAGTFAFIGDSVGVSVAGENTSPLRFLLEGVHTSQLFDSRGGRPTGGGADDGQDVAAKVPVGTDLVVVELGYNDSPSSMTTRIDALMQTLRDRGVGRVVWVTVSERRSSTDFAQTNAAIRSAAERWAEMIVIDWHAASIDNAGDRWYSDGVHLTTSGQAEFAVWLRDRIIEVNSDGYQPARRLGAGEVLRVPVLGVAGVPVSGVAGVALNVTAVGPSGPGFLRVWDCAVAEPETSSVNFVAAGAVEPNAVLVPLSPGGSGPDAGQVCVSSPLVPVDVVVDVSGWFDAGLRPAVGRVVDTREVGGPDRLAAGEVLRVPVLGVAGVPVSGVAGVALNVTAVGPSGPGFLRVWDCAVAEPETSSVNFVAAGAVEPNAVLVPLSPGGSGPDAGQVCVSSPLVPVDVVVDVSGWFDAGLRPAVGRLRDTRVGYVV